MKTHSINALGQSGMHAFLFAAVGIEPNGTTLSLASVFAREGKDPWAEADRLAALPKPAAIESLARTIAAMAGGRWTLDGASPIAARLVDLLPLAGTDHVTGITSVATGLPRRRGLTVIILAVAVLSAAYAGMAMMSGSKTMLVDDASTVLSIPLR